MAASRSRAQRNDFDVHLDSAGGRFGAMAQGAPGNADWAWAKSVETLRSNEDEGPEVLYRPLI